jgi:hypothetical protein
MKVFITLTYLLVSVFSFGQLLEGDLIDEGRKLISKQHFILEGTKDGWASYELAVNRKGEVTSARLVDTNLKSTPSKMQIRDYVMEFAFEPGTYYPKFHHVTVKITLLKPMSPPEEMIEEENN